MGIRRNPSEVNLASSDSEFSQEIPELFKKHLEHLKASAISLEVMKERGYITVMGKKKLEDLGFSKSRQASVLEGIARDVPYRYMRRDLV